MRKFLSKSALVAGLASVLVSGMAIPAQAGPGPKKGDSVVYSKTAVTPASPSGNFTGSSGVDTWNLGFDAEHVYGVSHAGKMVDGKWVAAIEVTCNNRSDGSVCPNYPLQEANYFHVDAFTSQHVDPVAGKMYLFAKKPVDMADSNGSASYGLLCIDLKTPLTPNCGYTMLLDGQSAVHGSGTFKYGTKLYSEVNSGTTHTSGGNSLVCYDLTTSAACPGQPFKFTSIDRSKIEYGYPAPKIAQPLNIIQIGSRLFSVYAGSVDCFDLSTVAACTGAWPVADQVDLAALADGNSILATAFLPVLSGGVVSGVCYETLKVAGWACVDLEGATITTPAKFSDVFINYKAKEVTFNNGTSDQTATVAEATLAGDPVIIGTRVYLQRWNGYEVADTGYGGKWAFTVGDVACYDYATNAGCPNFPVQQKDQFYNYTVNVDPAAPGCIWTNGDRGAGQIQTVDGYTGGACGASGQRALMASYVQADSQCAPTAYGTLEITDPVDWKSATVDFVDAGGNAISGLAQQTVDPTTHKLDLSSLGLEKVAGGLPQMLITMKDGSGNVINKAITASLTWDGTYDDVCVAGGQSALAGVTKYDVALTAGANGSVDNAGGLTVDGDTVTSTATADAGYQFDGWVCTPSSYDSTSATLTFSASEDVSCEATFSLIPAVTHSVAITAGAGGSVDNAGGTVNDGDTVTSTATADAGYQFDGWVCTPSLYDTTSATLSFSASEDVSCEATFSLIPAVTHSVAITAGAGGSVDNAGGTVIDGDTVTSTATADAGYQFDGWVCTPSSYDSTDATLTFDASEDVSCEARFSAIPAGSSSITITAGAGGSVDNAGGTVTDGDTVTSTATADAGYQFNGWVCTPSSYDSTEAKLSFIAGEDVSCEATFSKLPAGTVSVTISAGDGGSVSNAGGTVTEGDTVSSTATAKSGFVFTGWVCTPADYDTTDATLTFKAGESVSCKANFDPVKTIKGLTAPKGSYRAMPGGVSRIAWKKSAGAVKYVVSYNGQTLCETKFTRCFYGARLPKGAKVTVTAVDASGATSGPGKVSRVSGQTTAAKKGLHFQVYFNISSPVLTAKAVAKIKKYAALIKAGKYSRATVLGFTDDLGSTPSDSTLSRARAKSVHEYLKGLVPGLKFSADGLGRQSPAKPNTSEANRRLNRRVIVWVK